MVELIGVAFVSCAGWLISLAASRSAARRHLVLTTALMGCLLLPAVFAVRAGTEFKFLAIRAPSDAFATSSRLAAARRSDQSPRTPVEHIDLHGQRLLPELSSSQPDFETATAGALMSTRTPKAIPSSTAGLAADRQSSSPADEAPGRSSKFAGWALTIYVAVAFVLFLRLLCGLVAIVRVKRRAVAVDLVAGGVQVLEADVAVPLAIGFGRPAILLPRGFRGEVGPCELHDVLQHELEHLRHGDHRIMLLQRLAAAAYWPVITVHLLNRALNRAREERCDNAVLVGTESQSYCRTLLRVAEHIDRRLKPHWAPSISGPGELERRVAHILDQRVDRRICVSWIGRSTAACCLLGAVVLSITTRLEAGAGESKQSARAAGDSPTAQPIEWTGVPTVSRDQATLHRGVVFGPDETPLAGASIYAASTIELLQLTDADKVGPGDLGPVRAVTDAEGRFEFDAADLSWVTPSGVRKRWETLLVATSEGLAAGWIETWGEDRSFRDHWNPLPSKPVAIRMRPPASLTGTFSLNGGTPLANAKVRLTGLMAPRDNDLDRHIEQEEKQPLGLFSGVDYQASLYRPWVLPGLQTETQTDSSGRFEFPALPEGFIAQVEATHPQAVTSSFRAAIRSIDPVLRKSFDGTEESTPTLYGSGFHAEVPEGIVLKGQVVSAEWGNKVVIPGVTVAPANHNTKDGLDGQQFTTDAQGRFEVTGLPPSPEGYELAFVGSFDAPYRDHRQRIVAGLDASVELTPAVRYRLRLTDPEGHPVDRTVYSVDVQQTPGTVYHGVKARFNEARQAAPGLYQGIVPVGQAAVVVKRGAKSDRPAAVDPKEFFAPGRTDWTPEETRYTYGDAWRIAYTATSTTDRLASNMNPTIEQSELAAAVLTNVFTKDGVLELTAVVHTDPPVEVTLVDESGQFVEQARVERQITKYNSDKLPSSLSVYGLHPQRPETLVFYQDERKLIGALTTTWTGEPVRVTMRPEATISGRLVDQAGKPDYDFCLRIIGPGILPDEFVAGNNANPSETSGERSGEFRLVVAPDLEVRSEFLRKSPDALTRPSAGLAFGPLVPKPGEVIELGDLQVP